MLKRRYYRPAMCLAMMAFLLVGAFKAQEKASVPELSVAGIKLGHRDSAREFLRAFSPTTGEDGRPTYYFFNKYATQVMKITAASFDDPYYVTEVEVFAVGKSYEKAHFFAEKIGHFSTEDRIFIGFNQSTASMLIGIPGVSRGDMIGPKDVVRKKGAPSERVKADDGSETITYHFDNFQIPDTNAENRQYDYSARYEFRKNKLKRFKLTIAPVSEKKL